MLFFFLVPKEKLKTHDDEKLNKPDKKTKKKPKSEATSSQKEPPEPLPQMRDYFFKNFRKLCMKVSLENGHLKKMDVIKQCFDKISSKGITVFNKNIL